MAASQYWGSLTTLRQPHNIDTPSIRQTQSNSLTTLMQPHHIDAALPHWGSLYTLRQPYDSEAASPHWGSIFTLRQHHHLEAGSPHWGSITILRVHHQIKGALADWSSFTRLKKPQSTFLTIYYDIDLFIISDISSAMSAAQAGKVWLGSKRKVLCGYCKTESDNLR